MTFSQPEKLIELPTKTGEESRKLAIALRSGCDRKFYEQTQEIECRDVIESVLNANSRTHQAQDTARVT